ncbi:hypothetical protein ACLK1Z_23505 [Escherichia coli]
MGFTTRVKSEASEKKPFNFALFWDKYGTFFILAIIVAIFGSLSPEYFLTTNNITQIFVQSSVTVLIGMGSLCYPGRRYRPFGWRDSGAFRYGDR